MTYDKLPSDYTAALTMERDGTYVPRMIEAKLPLSTLDYDETERAKAADMYYAFFAKITMIIGAIFSLGLLALVSLFAYAIAFSVTLEVLAGVLIAALFDLMIMLFFVQKQIFDCSYKLSKRIFLFVMFDVMDMAVFFVAALAGYGELGGMLLLAFSVLGVFLIILTLVSASRDDLGIAFIIDFTGSTIAAFNLFGANLIGAIFAPVVYPIMEFLCYLDYFRSYVFIPKRRAVAAGSPGQLIEKYKSGFLAEVQRATEALLADEDASARLKGAIKCGYGIAQKAAERGKTTIRFTHEFIGGDALSLGEKYTDTLVGRCAVVCAATTLFYDWYAKVDYDGASMHLEYKKNDGELTAEISVYQKCDSDMLGWFDSTSEKTQG